MLVCRQEAEGPGSQGLGRLVFGDVDPADTAEGFEPGSLGFGEFSGVDFDLFDGLVERPFAVQVIDDFGISDGSASLGAEGFGFVQEGADFLDKSLIYHSFDSLVDAVVFNFFGASQADDGPVGGGRGLPLPLEFGDGPAG